MFKYLLANVLFPLVAAGGWWWRLVTAAKLIRATLSVTYCHTLVMFLHSLLSQLSSRSDWKYYSPTKTTDWHQIDISKYTVRQQCSDWFFLAPLCLQWMKICGFTLQCVQPQTSRNRNLRERQSRSSVAAGAGATPLNQCQYSKWSKLNLTRVKYYH